MPIRHSMDTNREWLLAAATCDEKRLKKLSSENPELVNHPSYIDGNTALHYAAKSGNLPVIRLLAGNLKANVDVKNAAGLCPLHMAACALESDAIFLLTSVYNADMSIRDHLGRPPSSCVPQIPGNKETKRVLKESVAMILGNPVDEIFALLVKESGRDKRARSRSPVIGPLKNIVDPASVSRHESQYPIVSHYPWQRSPVLKRRGSLEQQPKSGGLFSRFRSSSKDRSSQRSKKVTASPLSSDPWLRSEGLIFSPTEDKTKSGTSVKEKDFYDHVERFVKKKIARRLASTKGVEKLEYFETDKGDASSVQSLSVSSN